MPPTNCCYLIDKNILEDIRKINKNPEYEFLEFNRSIDTQQSIICVFLAVLEGNDRTPQTKEQLQISLLDAVQEIQKFYKYAKTDSDLLINTATQFIEMMGVHMPQKVQELIPTIKEIQKLLLLTYSTNDARSKLDEINAISNTNKIGLHHPVFVTAIHCLYGNSAARGVLFPKNSKDPEKNSSDNKAYNAAFDIRLLMEFFFIRKQNIQNAKVYLHTRDENLRILEKELNIYPKITDVENLSITIENLSIDIEFTPFAEYSCIPSLKYMPNLNKNAKEKEYVKKRLKELYKQDIN